MTDLKMYKKTCLVTVILLLQMQMYSEPSSGSEIHVDVNVTVVNLQVSVLDQQGQFIGELKPEDFLVREDGVPQEVLDLELNREPFSIGILLDTSSSMESAWKMTSRATEDFIGSLKPEDEFFLMTFDERLLVKKDFGDVKPGSTLKLEGFRFGEGTRLFDAIVAAIERLGQAHYPRRALFLISDGVNTRGGSDLKEAIETAQKHKAIIYTLVIAKSDTDLNTMRELSESTGGTYFILFDEFPRLQAAYQKIASDLAHRFTLYYHSSSDYSKSHRPLITVSMKDPRLKVRYQKAYFPD